MERWRGGEHGGVFEAMGVPPFFYSLSLLCLVVQGGASVKEPHTNRALLSSNNSKTLAGPAKCWQTAAQHWKTPTINDSLKTSWTWNILLGFVIIYLFIYFWASNKSLTHSISKWDKPGVHTYILSPGQEQQVSWNTTGCQTVKACRDAATPQVHHGGSSCIQRGKASHHQTPLSNPVIWEYPVINELDRNGSPRFKVCWLKWRREFQSEHRGGSSCDHCSMRVSVCVSAAQTWLHLSRPQQHNNSTALTQLHWRAYRPQWTGVNTNPVGTEA